MTDEATRRPQTLYWAASDPEYSYLDLSEMLQDHSHRDGEVVEVQRAVMQPNAYVVQMPTADGDDYEIREFPSRAEAELWVAGRRSEIDRQESLL